MSNLFEFVENADQVQAFRITQGPLEGLVYRYITVSIPTEDEWDMDEGTCPIKFTYEILKNPTRKEDLDQDDISILGEVLAFVLADELSKDSFALVSKADFVDVK